MLKLSTAAIALASLAPVVGQHAPVPRTAVKPIASRPPATAVRPAPVATAGEIGRASTPVPVSRKDMGSIGRRPSAAPATSTVRDLQTKDRITIDPRGASDFRKTQAEAREKARQERLRQEEARKRDEEARLQAEKDRSVAQCNASGGEWVATVQGISLTASGTDVDEIYGKVSVVDIPNSRFSSSRTDSRNQWGSHEIWASQANVNIGKYDQTNLSTVTIVSTSSRGEILIRMDLHDEDDGRGGSNDEFFYLDGATNSYLNFHRFEFYVPPCWQAVQFSREWRVTLTGSPMGSASSNKVRLFVAVKVSRH